MPISRSQEAIAAWLEKNREALITAYVDLALGSPTLTAYHSISARDLHDLAARELDGLTSHVLRDQVALDRVQEVHRNHANRLTAQIPVAQQLAYVRARIELVKHLFTADPSTKEEQVTFAQMLDDAARYYQIATRSIEIEKSLGKLADQ
jgi:hypothetical protein